MHAGQYCININTGTRIISNNKNLCGSCNLSYAVCILLLLFFMVVIIFKRLIGDYFINLYNWIIPVPRMIRNINAPIEADTEKTPSRTPVPDRRQRHKQDR